jgi:hypothetical protein
MDWSNLPLSSIHLGVEKNWFYLLEEDELKHPLEIRLLCARGIMPELDLITQLIEKIFGGL